MFLFLPLSAVWRRVLAVIDICNRPIHARYVTLDVEVSKIETLLEDLMK